MPKGRSTRKKWPGREAATKVSDFFSSLFSRAPSKREVLMNNPGSVPHCHGGGQFRAASETPWRALTPETIFLPLETPAHGRSGGCRAALLDASDGAFRDRRCTRRHNAARAGGRRHG